jgi:hypothetical protein
LVLADARLYEDKRARKAHRPSSNPSITTDSSTTN